MLMSTEEKNIPDEPVLRHWVYLLLPLVFLLIVFPMAFQPDHGFISDYHDPLGLILPDYFLIHNPLALWDNQWLTGFSDISSMNSDRFYPFSFPFFLLSQNIFVLDLILLLHLYIAFLALFKLGSLVVKDDNLLFILSLGYMFSGVLMSRIQIGHIFFVYAMAWIPLILYFFLKITYSNEPTVVNILALALCDAMLVFNAATYYLFFCNAILAIYFLYYLAGQKLSRSQIVALAASAVLFLSVSSVKLLPDLLGLAFIQRIDLINPLGDGGVLENNLASFVFGTPIDTVFGPYETMALIGIIPILFAIIALVWGKRDLTVPSFFAIVFSLVWADGGRILISFIHLLPLLDSFRNAGRIFGAIMPVVLLLSVYGVFIVQDRVRKNEPFTVTEEQKRTILCGLAILAAVKLLELPWIAIPSLEAGLAVVLVLGFILMVYLNKATVRSLLYYFAGALLVDALVIARDFTILTEDVLLKGLLIAVVAVGALLYFNRKELGRDRAREHAFIALLVLGILISAMGNISVQKPSDPRFDQSPARDVIAKIQEDPQPNPQIWIFETGWPIKHMDFTYLFIRNGLHPMRAFYSYIPINTPPLAFKLNGTDYYTADYLVDTAYLENGNQNLPNVTFTADNISVYHPDHVMSNVFVVRGDSVVPVIYQKFSPDEVTVTGQFRMGDIAVLKTAFSPGWKVNNQNAGIVSSMPGAPLAADTETITFRYDPPEVKAGLVLTAIGIFLLIVLYIKRKEGGDLLRHLDNEPPEQKSRKKGKGRRD